ncbi:hypothetical protein NC653_041555 [Populus alba x Populus x berolinensis]|uniref:Uncharacterized protein n=1 Tax=Populus alba x Populus x berolinensis TaxID=444605 RepID=A0AAD6PQX9_9ROSI|nr:hypothetical protein NC653_041555 [Populus alba x Populus x berolinensis]
MLFLLSFTFPLVLSFLLLSLGATFAYVCFPLFFFFLVSPICFVLLYGFCIFYLHSLSSVWLYFCSFFCSPRVSTYVFTPRVLSVFP